jgi:hypothetical protein
LAPMVLAIAIGDKAGRCIPPIDADVEGFTWVIFQQYAGDDAGLAWRDPAGAAFDLTDDRENDGACAVNALTNAWAKNYTQPSA